ncbi:MAG: hypothetical protein NZM13_07085 [Cyclobacteriaceae bacterium]|nr:hypothetical protein [Cyclobacteriaceae bacterium]
MKLNPLALPFIFDVPAYRIRKRLAILINQPWAELTEEARTTLHKLIQAVNLPVHHVAVIERTHLQEEEVKYLNADFIIAFGVTVDNRMEPYRLFQFHYSRVVLADNLQVFSIDKNLKQKLWDILRSNFRPA